MRKSFLCLAFFALTGNSVVCFGQYTGGNEDGYSSGLYVGGVCSTPLNGNIYFGGLSNNSSDAALSASLCTAPVNANIYFGGVEDGSSQSALTASVCPIPVNANIYFGGVEDGSSQSALTASVCPIHVNANIYFGGAEDGSSQGKLAVSVCPIPVNANIYFGGVEDGSSQSALTASVCPIPVNANIYFGGSEDGFSSVFLKTLLASCLLPIELSSLKGDCAGGVKVLSWSTAEENDNGYFTIEYSSDGINWQAAATMPGAGNSSVTRNYTFTDGAIRAGVTYYRLQQTDMDGKTSLSSIISVGSCIAAGMDKLNIYPNPSPGELILSFDGDKSKVQSIEVYNVLGERIYYSGAWQSGIDLSDRPSGTYFVHFTTDLRTVIKEVVIKKD
jgi:Secretion system C-terminal sorting domain